MSPKLSVCMIVRDEADVLPRCLASIEGIADEIIAVDTGSTDGSRGILERAGARVFSFTWQDDFGAARTFSLRQATGDWVLVLDADEAFDRTMADHLRAVLVDVDFPTSYDVAIQSYTTDDEDPQAITLSWMPRLFNHPQSHLYVGTVHEQLIGSSPLRLDSSLLRIDHWGYQPSRIAAKGKLARNERLLNLDRDRTGDSLGNHLYRALNATDGREKVRHGKQALKHYRTNGGSPIITAIASTTVVEGYLQTGQWQTALAEGQKLRQQFPALENEGIFLLALGNAHRMGNELSEAAKTLQLAVNILQGDRALQSYWNEQTPAKAIDTLVHVLAQLGRKEEAVSLIETTIEKLPMSKSLRAVFEGNLARLHADQGNLDEAIELSHQAIKHDPDLCFKLANVFLQLDHHVAALELASLALDDQQLRDRTMTIANGLRGDRRAIDVIEWYLEHQGNVSEVRRNLGLHWLALGEPDKAAEAIAASFNTAPDDARVVLQLAYFEQELGHHTAAEARLVALVIAADEAGQTTWAAEALIQWANLAYHRQEWAKAADLYAQAITLRPQDAYLQFAGGMALGYLGDFHEARSRFERALVLEPGHPEALQGLDAIERAIALS